MSYFSVTLVLFPPVIAAVYIGLILLRRAFSYSEKLPEEFALAVAWVFVVGGLFWLGVYFSDSIFLGFGVPWTWLAAAHFIFAGYGALTITAMTCRVISSKLAQRWIRVLIFIHPVSYLITAGGILGYPYCDELGATGYAFIFITQLGAFFFGKPNRMSKGPLVLFAISLIVPLGTIIPALSWAWGSPIFGIYDMVRYHGVANAIGHVCLGLTAFGWGRPKAHSKPLPSVTEIHLDP